MMNKSISVFLKRTGITVMAFLLVLVIGLTVFWKYLESYQKTDADIPIDQFVEYIKAGDYASALNIIEDSSVFENEDHLSRFVLENFPSGFEQLSVVSQDLNDGKYIYTVNNGSKPVFTLNVSPSENNVGFGLLSAKIDLVSVNEIAPINITVPQGAVVFVNGAELNSDSAKTTVLDKLFSTVTEELYPKMVTYVSDGHIVYPEIAVTYDFEYIEQDSTTVTKELVCEAVGDDKFNLLFSVSLSDSLLHDVAVKALDSSKAYESFIFRGGHINYLLRHVYSESAFYTEMKDYDNTDRERQYGISYSEEAINRIQMFDNTHFMVDASFVKTIKVSGQPVTEKKNYIVSIINIDGDLKVTDIVVK